MQTILIFLIVIVFLVVIHELGHFFVAKSFGIRVEEFGVGYPPRARKLFTWKGTLFTLNWLPFGGFVKIYGEETSVQDSNHSFAYQKLWKRVAVVLAGVAANFVLAVVLYVISFSIGFLASPGEFSSDVIVGPNQTLISAVAKNSPAGSAGLLVGDTIQSLTTAKETVVPQNVTDVVHFIQRHSSDSIVVSIDRKGKTQSFVITPKAEKIGEVPTVGISLAEVVYTRLPFWKSVTVAIPYTAKQFVSIIQSLWSLIAGSFGGGSNVLSQVSGPIGIAQVAKQALAVGFGSFLSFVALISINLSVINLFPFPALDGGRCILELFSKNGRSRIPQKIVSIINQLSFLLLILLMLYVTYHDIIRL